MYIRANTALQGALRDKAPRSAPDAYLLQGLVALMAVLQVASVVVVRKREQ